MGRIGICSKEGEKWHREVVALINIYLKAFEALYESYAQKGFGVPSIDGSLFLLGSTTTYETIKILGLSMWGRSPLMITGSYYIPVETKEHKKTLITIEGQAGEGIGCSLSRKTRSVDLASPHSSTHPRYYRWSH
ncbi:MAG: hypothetical protein RQ885_13950 [Desulfurococcales archaeon]|jgi:hypothetical protein|nr:hypothetical protein [Desulfurococcales archaeon]